MSNTHFVGKQAHERAAKGAATAEVNGDAIYARINGIVLTSDQILKMLRSKFEQNGLVCEKGNIKKGEVSGGGTLEEETWNPFAVKREKFHRAQGHILVNDVSRYRMKWGDKDYEAMDIEITGKVIHKMGPSILAFLAAFGFISLLVFYSGGIGPNVIGYAIMFFLLYYPLKGVMKLIGLLLTIQLRKKLNEQIEGILRSLNAEYFNSAVS